MSDQELQLLDVPELVKLWNRLGKAFEGVLDTNTPRVGLFALSRETERRGLETDKNLFGDIILKPIGQEPEVRVKIRQLPKMMARRYKYSKR